MKTRMQPIGNVWSKFPRVVRDLARTFGKQVRIEMEGEDTELDKTIVEAIKDPLTHLVRNSVDHGIEGPDARRAAGKDEGVLLLRAYHEGGQVNLEITDDGAGIDVERLRVKAVEKGVVTPEHAARMTEREVLFLIFAPGFSTAEKVTNVSGRGVGMDVVKTNIEKIGGTIDVQSRPGEGTTFKIKIPLTLAIIPALVVTSGGERYAIPQVSLLELVRLDGGNAQRSIERIHGVPVYRLRGNLLPLVDLNEELDVVGDDRGGAVNIVVLQADGRQFGLVVDRVDDTQEIVVKPLGSQLKGVPVFAGATIMGDGRVALILDVVGLAQRAHVVTEGADRARVDDAHRFGDGTAAESLLVAGLGQRRVAVPLSMVSRLEEFAAGDVERAGHHDVVQYRGRILPLVHLAGALGVEQGFGEVPDVLNVVVYAHHGRHVGLVVDRILDIVEEVVPGDAADGWRRASLVIQGRVTDVVDVAGVVGSFGASLFEVADQQAGV